jgi:hypothetical protein
MKALTKGDFDRRLTQQVNATAGALDKLTRLVERRPDLFDEAQEARVLHFLQGRMTAMQDRMATARRTLHARDEFSLDGPAPIVKPFIPPTAPTRHASETEGRLVGTGPRVIADGVDFIDED